MYYYSYYFFFYLFFTWYTLFIQKNFFCHFKIFRFNLTKIHILVFKKKRKKKERKVIDCIINCNKKYSKCTSIPQEENQANTKTNSSILLTK